MASPTLFLKTDVRGVFRIPGPCWSGDPLNPTSLGVSGPWGYLLVMQASAVLIDVPHFSAALVKEVQQQAPNGISHLFLSHDDFVDNRILASWKKDHSSIFTGDSIAFWGGEATGFGFRCHFGQREQAASLRMYASKAPFRRALFPGHGSPAFFKDAQERSKFFEEAARGLEGKRPSELGSRTPPCSTSLVQAAGFLPTSVSGIFAMPGGKWGTEESHAGAWGYFVPQGQAMRKVDTSHVTEGLACLIKCLKPELALPWGFLVMEPDDTVTLIDVPYFSQEVVEKVQLLAKKGLKHIIFTHSDFIGVAEPQEWHKSFPSVKIIAHRDDVLSCGAMESETLLEGAGPWQFGDYRIDAAPGHTKGSVIISSSTFSTSFGGDSMGFWEGSATGYPKMARHSCKEQAESLRRFADAAPFYKYWLPGHGLPLAFADEADRRRQLSVAAEDLEKASLNDDVTAP